MRNRDSRRVSCEFRLVKWMVVVVCQLVEGILSMDGNNPDSILENRGARCPDSPTFECRPLAYGYMCTTSGLPARREPPYAIICHISVLFIHSHFAVARCCTTYKVARLQGCKFASFKDLLEQRIEYSILS